MVDRSLAQMRALTTNVNVLIQCDKFLVVETSNGFFLENMTKAKLYYKVFFYNKVAVVQNANRHRQDRLVGLDKPKRFNLLIKF